VRPMTTPVVDESAGTSAAQHKPNKLQGSGSFWPGISVPVPLLVAVVALVVLSGTLAAMPEAQMSEALAIGSRLTARLTFLFFIVAYLARPVWQRFRWPQARWALTNRRWLGLAAALSHSVHLGYVVAYRSVNPEASDWVTLVFGGLGFFLFWVLGVTSNDSSVQALGRRWRWLHRGGIHYLWFIFLVTYAGVATLVLWMWGFVALLLAGAGLRAANHFSKPEVSR